MSGITIFKFYNIFKAYIKNWNFPAAFLMLVTVTVQLSVLLWTVAVTVAVPARLPITSPDDETVHTLGLEQNRQYKKKQAL